MWQIFSWREEREQTCLFSPLCFLAKVKLEPKRLQQDGCSVLFVHPTRRAPQGTWAEGGPCQAPDSQGRHCLSLGVTPAGFSQKAGGGCFDPQPLTHCRHPRTGQQRNLHCPFQRNNGPRVRKISLGFILYWLQRHFRTVTKVKRNTQIISVGIPCEAGDRLKAPNHSVSPYSQSKLHKVTRIGLK